MVSRDGEGMTIEDFGPGAERRDLQRGDASQQAAPLQSVTPPSYGRGLIVSIGAAAIAFALAIFASGGTREVTGIPMTQTTGALFWGLTVLAIIVVATGAQYAEGQAALAAASLGQDPRPRSIPAAWAVPAASVATALLLVATYHNNVMLIAGPLIAFFGVAGGLFARDLLEDTLEGTERTAALIHTIVVHGVAFLGLSAVYMNKMTGWYGGPIVFLLTAVLVFEHLERARLDNAIRVLYAVLTGGLMTIALLALAWWPTYGWTGGAALLLCFFVLAGLASTRGNRASLTDRDLIEYGAVFAGGILILAITL